MHAPASARNYREARDTLSRARKPQAPPDRRIRITADELATRMRMGIGYVRGLLDELEASGLVERDTGNFYRRTPLAEARFGEALRGVEPR